MRLRTVIGASVLALAPALALAAQPMLVHVDGQAVPAQVNTRIIQTAAGPARVSTWSWHSPHGNASFEVQTSTGGAPPAWALRQMQAMQSQVAMMQSQMQQLQHAALNEFVTLPAPLAVVFAPPVLVGNGLPGAVTVVAPPHGTMPTSPVHSAGVKI